MITNPTNLYSQAFMPSLDYTLSFHIGFMARVAGRREPEGSEAEQEFLIVTDRRLVQASADRELVVDELAATVGKDRGQADQACAVLLAAAGGEPSDQAAVWERGTADRRPGGGDDGSRRKQCNLRGKKDGGWHILNRGGGPKWKSQVY